MSEELGKALEEQPSVLPPAAPVGDKQSEGAVVAPQPTPQVTSEVTVDPATLPFYRRLHQGTLTALGCFWLAFICLIAALIIQTFYAKSNMETWHFVAVIAHWIFWGVAAVSSASALLFARFREKLAALLLLTVVAVDLTYLILPIAAGEYGWIYKLLRIFVDFDLLVAATYIATRKPRTKR